MAFTNIRFLFFTDLMDRLLAITIGAKIIKANEVMHGKLSKIKHNGEGIFSSLDKEFLATRYHSLVIEEASLPKEFEITARSEDGTIMAIQHSSDPITGMQFHPESIATENGKTILKNFLDDNSK